MYSMSLARAFQKFFSLTNKRLTCLFADEQLEFIIFYSQACSQISLTLAVDGENLISLSLYLSQSLIKSLHFVDPNMELPNH